MLKKVKFKNFRSFTRETLIDLNASKIEYLGETNCIDGILKGVSFFWSECLWKNKRSLCNFRIT